MLDLKLTMRGGAFSIAAVLAAGMLMASPSVAQETTAPEDGYTDVNDPFEPMNRAIFSFNLGFDKIILRPTALAYRAVLPAPARESATNFLDNLESPVIFLNDLLQAKPGRAANTLARFSVNTVIGFFGFFDPAEDMGLARHDEDFAQTLGAWGVSSGPYLVLPLLGPLPPRDTVGFVADVFTDPMTYVLRENRAATLALYSVDLVNEREQVIEEFDELEKTSVDYYAAIRSLYRQRMDDLIRDGEPDMDNLPSFDDEISDAP